MGKTLCKFRGGLKLSEWKEDNSPYVYAPDCQHYEISNIIIFRKYLFYDGVF